MGSVDDQKLLASYQGLKKAFQTTFFSFFFRVFFSILFRAIIYEHRFEHILELISFFKLFRLFSLNKRFMVITENFERVSFVAVFPFIETSMPLPSKNKVFFHLAVFDGRV